MKKLITGAAIGLAFMASTASAAIPDSLKIAQLENEIIQLQGDIKDMVKIINKYQNTFTLENPEFDHQGWKNGNAAIAGYWVATLDNLYKNEKTKNETLQQTLDDTTFDFTNQINELEANLDTLETKISDLEIDLATTNEEKATKVANLNATIDELQADLDEWTDHIIVKHKSHGGLLKGKTDQYAPGTDNYYVHGQMYSHNVSDPNRYFRIYNSANPDLDPSHPDTQWGGFSGAYDISKGSGRVAYANIVHADAEVGSIIHIKSTQILKLKDGWIIPKHNNLPVSSSYSQYAINQYPGHSAIAEEVGYKGGWTTNSVGAFVWSSSDSNPSFNWRTKSSQSVRNMIMRIARGSYDTGFREGYNQGFEDGYNLGYLHGSQGQPHKDAK